MLALIGHRLNHGFVVKAWKLLKVGQQRAGSLSIVGDDKRSVGAVEEKKDFASIEYFDAAELVVEQQVL